MREMWHWILKIVQYLQKWLVNISEVLNARNVTLNPENCPTFAKMAYHYKWNTECEKCDIEVKWFKGRVSSLICKNRFFEHNWVFSTHMASRFGRFGQRWKPDQDKLLSARKLEAERCMHAHNKFIRYWKTAWCSQGAMKLKFCI